MKIFNEWLNEAIDARDVNSMNSRYNIKDTEYSLHLKSLFESKNHTLKYIFVNKKGNIVLSIAWNPKRKVSLCSLSSIGSENYKKAKPVPVFGIEFDNKLPNPRYGINLKKQDINFIKAEWNEMVKQFNEALELAIVLTNVDVDKLPHEK